MTLDRLSQTRSHSHQEVCRWRQLQLPMCSEQPPRPSWLSGCLPPPPRQHPATLWQGNYGYMRAGRHMVRNHIQETNLPSSKHEEEFTSGDAPVVETGVADSDRCKAPTPLRDRPGFCGAGITEALSTGTTVVLGVIGLELFPTFVTFLQHTELLEISFHFAMLEHNMDAFRLHTRMRELGFQ